MTTQRFRLFLCASALGLSLCSLPALAQEGGYGGTNAYSAAATGMETRLSSLEDQVRSLTGKVEQVDFVLRRMDQALQRMQGDYDARLTKLESAPPPAVPAAIQQPSAPSNAGMSAAHAAEEADEIASTPQQPVAGTLGGVKMSGGKVTGAVAGGKTPPLPQTPADYGLTAQEAYDRAFGLLRQANYEDAEKAFKGMIDKYPQDKSIDNAKYWYAETYYVRGKFGDAAVAFADAFQHNPKGTKAPDSLLKLAMSLAAVDKGPDACSTLDALKAKYPNAAQTIRARADQERARLKCK